MSACTGSTLRLNRKHMSWHERVLVSGFLLEGGGILGGLGRWVLFHIQTFYTENSEKKDASVHKTN